MLFSMQHRFSHSIEKFTDNDPPKWLISKCYNWWYTEHVLVLKIGNTISTDFRTITRIK